MHVVQREQLVNKINKSMFLWPLTLTFHMRNTLYDNWSYKIIEIRECVEIYKPCYSYFVRWYCDVVSQYGWIYWSLIYWSLLKFHS